ncbi:hypothetical protein HPB50_012810 [Hyalomma asiaticum]|uniref:Uncharacterized protein n=1 Tax=Hyalomma asiaticum TaxID=266040 RepID=A0ACB7RQQ0_HYAAI|nr:hypothetical protein HPB50_012810 [Hyalomma asiaticum]
MLFLAILMAIPSVVGKSRMSMFGDYLMDLVGNMFFESTPEPPEDSYRRWLTSFWWIVVMVVMTGFTGIMKASMMVKDQAGRINTIQDVVARPHIRPFVIDGSTYHRLFSVRRRISVFISPIPPILFLSSNAVTLKGTQKQFF